MTNIRVVKKGSDYAWLRKQAKDQKTLKELNTIQRSEERVQDDIFSTDTSVFSIKLGKHTYWLRRSDAYYSLQIYTEIFKENDHFLLDTFMPKDTQVVIDLGAHLGFYTLKLKELCPKCRVIALEPDKFVFSILEKNMKANNIKNVELVNKAAAESNQVIPFHYSINAGVLGSKYLRTLKRDFRAWLKDSMIEKTEVKGVTLTSLMKEYKLSVVDLIKIDIEDMEYEVLKASEESLKNVKSIIMQWHNAKTRDQVIELLKKHGFAMSYCEPRDYGDIYFTNSRFMRM